MARKLSDDAKELIVAALFLVAVVIGALVYSHIKYGDASCLFKNCVVVKEDK